MLRSLAYSPILSALGATLLLTAFGGCGAGDVSPPPPLADAGTDSPTTTDAPPGATTQTGKIIDLSTKSAIADAKITTGTFTATTDAKGNYSVQVDPTQPFNMHVEKTGYYTLIEQSTLVKTSFNLGNTSFLSENTANLLTQTLPGFDPTLAAVSTDIEIRGGCTDETGATFDFTVDGSKLTGTVSGARSHILDGKIDGDEISFTAVFDIGGSKVGMDYVGKVSGDRISFTRTRSNGESVQFTAVRSK